MHFAIIFAMDEELRAFLNLQDSYETESLRGHTLYRVEDGPHTVSAVRSGIGKTHSAYVATALIERIRPDALLNVGVAGGLDVPFGTLVVGSKIAYHDVDVTAFHYPYGQIPGAPDAFDADEGLLLSARKAFNTLSYAFKEGTILTGDQFVKGRSSITKALSLNPQALAVDMEAAAIAHVAWLEALPFLCIRTISDELDTDIQMETYEDEMERSAAKAAETVKAMIGIL